MSKFTKITIEKLADPEGIKELFPFAYKTPTKHSVSADELGGSIDTIYSWTFHFKLKNPEDINSFMCNVVGTVKNKKTRTGNLIQLNLQTNIFLTENGEMFKLGESSATCKKFYNQSINKLCDMNLIDS